MQTKVRYEPRGAAVDLLEAREPEVLISGPAGTGKSMGLMFKLHLTSMAVPGMRSLIVRQTHASLTSTTLETFRKHVATEALAQDVVRWFGGNAQRPAAYMYGNGSEILVGGLDRPDKFLSSEFDRIIIDEAHETTLNAYQTLITRLRGTAPTYRQIAACCNPQHPTHWIKMRADGGKMRALTSLHQDNPALFNADGSMTPRGREYMALLDALEGVKRLRLRDGIWAAAEGLIYGGFNTAVHVVGGLPKGSETWTRYWTVDFGMKHPFVLQCWAEDGDDRLWLYRELYRTDRLVEDHAADILGIVAPGGVWREPKPQAIICDHDLEDRKTLAKHTGMVNIAAKKDVSTGIEAVASRLKPAGDGRPRLFVVRGCTVERDSVQVNAGRPASTEEEFPQYIWADIKTKDQPVKEGDDGMDALRYMVAHRDLRATPNIRGWF